MYDFHSHFLPNLDDGSQSVDESLAMLRESRRQGVTHIVATPHFYADLMTPDEFLEKRRIAWDTIKLRLNQDMPSITLGAEVHYYEGLSHMEQLQRLCIENTDLLLLEMPQCAWNIRWIDTLINLNGLQNIRVLLAHFERCLPYQPKSLWSILARNGILFQSNASYFISSQTRHAALKALKGGRIYLLGSDCHNMGERKPNLGAAFDIIQRKLGDNVLDILNQHGREAFHEMD